MTNIKSIFATDKKPHRKKGASYRNEIGGRSKGRDTTGEVPLHIIEQRLLHILSNHSLINAGRIQLIGLDALRDKLGDKWPSLRDNVYRALYDIVSEKLDKDDVFFRRSDTEFMFVFAHLGLEAAQTLAASILMELQNYFLGETATKDVTVRTAVGEIKGELLFKEDHLNNILENIAPRAGQVTDEDVRAAKRKNRISTQEQNPNTTPRQTELHDDEVDLEVMELGFRPLLDVRHEAISTYLVNMTEEGYGGHKRLSYDILSNRDSKEAIIGLDWLMLSSATHTLEELYHSNVRSILSVPLNYETVFTQALLMGYISRCKTIPSYLYRYLTFRLVDFPEGIPSGKLGMICSSLKPYCGYISLVVSPLRNDLSFIKACGVNAVIGTLSSGNSKIRFYEDALELFVKRSHQCKLGVGFLDVNDKEQAQMLKDAGADFIIGDFVGDYQDKPGHMLRRSWADLMSK